MAAPHLPTLPLHPCLHLSCSPSFLSLQQHLPFYSCSSSYAQSWYLSQTLSVEKKSYTAPQKTCIKANIEKGFDLILQFYACTVRKSCRSWLRTVQFCLFSTMNSCLFFTVHSCLFFTMHSCLFFTVHSCPNFRHKTPVCSLFPMHTGEIRPEMKLLYFVWKKKNWYSILWRSPCGTAATLLTTFWLITFDPCFVSCLPRTDHLKWNVALLWKVSCIWGNIRFLWSRIEMRGDWRLRQHGAKIGKFLLCTFKSWIFPVNCFLFKPKFGTFAFLHVCLKCPLSLIPRSILGTLICEDKNQFNMGCNICLMFICHCPIVALACSIDLMEILFGTFLQKPKASKLFLHNFINLPISILISLCWVD